MIWIGNVTARHERTTQLELLDQVRCGCAHCIVADGAGLFEIGPVHASTAKERAQAHAMGFVGLYRVRSKPWKEGSREVRAVRRRSDD